MELSPFKINTFLLFKLPAAYLCGVRVKFISEKSCISTVKHRWINKNPFHSMYFAVQCMAAELTTGVLVMYYIKKSGKQISMLVGKQSGSYEKKATGRITFECEDGLKIQQAIINAVQTGEGQELILNSIGKNSKGEIVSKMDFHWFIKLKSS